MQFREYIEINSDVRFGKPVIKGTRITVADILQMLGNGLTIKDIIEDFPLLNENQIYACLLYSSERERLLVTVWNY